MNILNATRVVLSVAAAVTVVYASPASAAAQDRQEMVALEWRETMEPGSRLFLHNMNGGITVGRATGNQAEVIVRKSWRRSDPELVRVEARRTGGGRNATICAFWTENGSCEEESYISGRRRDGNRDMDVNVTYEVRLPDGVNLYARTVNGGLSIDGVSGSVDARTVNGAVRASSMGGPVQAETVNGAINVKMGTAGSSGLRYKTVNGAITIELPDDFAGHLSLRTVNGSLQSDFPITVQGRFNPRRIDAQIGEGGPRLEAETVNGGVRLRKASGN